MKNSKETDLFKEALRTKFNDEYVRTDRDSELWEKVAGQLKGNNPAPQTSYIRYYAAAASVILCLSVAAWFYFYKTTHSTKHNVSLAVEPKISPKEIISTSTPESPELQENKIVKVESVNKEKVLASVSKLPDFIHGPHYRSSEKSVSIKLSDGSVITLNSESDLSEDKSLRNQRNVSLDGEAFFEVASDKTRPFSVYFSDIKLVVVGTKFNVRSRKNEAYKEITVEEGIVRVFDNITKEGILVTRGEQLIVYPGKPSALKKVDSDNYFSWKTGKLDFRKTKLEDIAVILSRTMDNEVIVDSAIRKCKFTGDLSGLSLDEAIQVLSLTNSLHVEKKDGKIYLMGKSCD